MFKLLLPLILTLAVLATYGTDADTMNNGFQNRHQEEIPFDPDTFPNPPGITTQEYPRLEDLVPRSEEYDGNSSTTPSIVYVFAPPGVKYNGGISNETVTIITESTPTNSSSEGQEEE